MLAERRAIQALNVECRGERAVPTYHQQILDELARHGLVPASGTSPGRLRDAVRDLYKYEIRKLRDRVVAGDIPKGELAALVVELRKRYWLLSVPTALWVESDHEGL
jgi:hypothetical protein